MSDAASILVNNEINKIDSILASNLVTDTTSIFVNSAIDKINYTLPSSLETNAAFIFVNNAAANIDSTFFLLPFPNTSLSFDFYCFTGINFTFHPLLYHNHLVWIEFILSILQILVSSLQLKDIFLFSHRDPDNLCLFVDLIPFVQSTITSWYISNHLIFSNNLGYNVSCSRSFLYLSLLKHKSPSLFTPNSASSFPILSYWLSSTFHTSNLVFLLQKILPILHSHLQPRIYSIILDLKVLYSRPLRSLLQYLTQSLIPFIQS